MSQASCLPGLLCIVIVLFRCLWPVTCACAPTALFSSAVTWRHRRSFLVLVPPLFSAHWAIMSSNVNQFKKLVEQLRVEYTSQRVPLSTSIRDLIAYTEQNKECDPLIVGIDKKQNPYLEKNSCSILWVTIQLRYFDAHNVTCRSWLAWRSLLIRVVLHVSLSVWYFVLYTIIFWNNLFLHFTRFLLWVVQWVCIAAAKSCRQARFKVRRNWWSSCRARVCFRASRCRKASPRWSHTSTNTAHMTFFSMASWTRKKIRSSRKAAALFCNRAFPLLCL